MALEAGNMVQWCPKATEFPWKCLWTAPAIFLQAGAFVPAFMPCLSLQRTLLPPCHSCMGADRSSIEHEHKCKQADSLRRTCKSHLRTFFHPLIFFQSLFLKQSTTAFSSQKLYGQWMQTHQYMQMHPNLKALIFISVCDTCSAVLFTVKHLTPPSFSFLLHYVRRINLLFCWEIPVQCVGLQVLTETLTTDNFYVCNLSLIFVICSETLTHNWFLTSCPQPAAMPSRSLLSGCCSFHPAVGFLVLSPCGCKERVKM